VYFSNVARIAKTGENEVTIELKRPDAIVNQVIATPAGIVGNEAFDGNNTEVLIGETIQSAAQQMGLPLKLNAMPAAPTPKCSSSRRCGQKMDGFLTRRYNDVADPLEITSR